MCGFHVDDTILTVSNCKVGKELPDGVRKAFEWGDTFESNTFTFTGKLITNNIAEGYSTITMPDFATSTECRMPNYRNRMTEKLTPEEVTEFRS